MKNVQKSPESTSSIPNFSEIKKPMNPAKRAATPPETVSYCGDREYFNFVYILSSYEYLKYSYLNNNYRLFLK